MDSTYDIAVVGAGIAGASIAYELAKSARVLVLERESQPGYHTTGRSAALFSETYGPSSIQSLTRFSRSFYENPPECFTDTDLLTPRGVLFVARRDQEAKLEETCRLQSASGSVRPVDRAEALALWPLLREDYVAAAMMESEARDIDVNALHQGYLRGFRKQGGDLVCNAGLRGLSHDGRWTLETETGTFFADIVVNAAGAWVDEVAALAGVEPIGIVPKRRTAMVIDAPAGTEANERPMVVDIDEEFYLKPDAGRFLISPADATPTEPCDVQPEELDVAICIDRIQQAFNIEVRRIHNSWAGLRSFVADGEPVCGFEPDGRGFFWLAGQGGYGIQSAPGLSRFAAALVRGEDIPAGLTSYGMSVHSLSPDRLGRAA
ncbi:FAD-binding oxidoreductase [Hoeflea sp. CAU 1731]